MRPCATLVRRSAACPGLQGRWMMIFPACGASSTVPPGGRLEGVRTAGCSSPVLDVKDGKDGNGGLQGPPDPTEPSSRAEWPPANERSWTRQTRAKRSRRPEPVPPPPRPTRQLLPHERGRNHRWTHVGPTATAWHKDDSTRARVAAMMGTMRAMRPVVTASMTGNREMRPGQAVWPHRPLRYRGRAGARGRGSTGGEAAGAAAGACVAPGDHDYCREWRFSRLRDRRDSPGSVTGRRS